MEITQRIQHTRAPGKVITTLTLTAPDGATERYVATIDDEDIARFARALENSEGVPVEGCACDEVGVDAPGAPLWWWKAVSAKAEKKNVNDTKAMGEWWNRKTPDEREWARAMFRGVQNWGLESNPAAGHARLLEVGKKGRERILHRYKRGIWDAGRVAKKSGAIAAKVAPVALAVIPGIGPVAAGLAAVAITMASKIGSAKAMDIAASGLEQAAAIKGLKIPPQAKEMIGKLRGSARLTAADVAAEVGATKTAQQIIQQAKTQIAQLVPAARAPAVLAAANATRKRAVAYAAGKPLPPKAPPASRAPIDVIARARAGKVRSNKGGAVTPRELADASASGRVFFLTA